VLELTGGPAGSMPEFDGFIFCPPGASRALFLASDGTRGVELWRTNGTPLGTALQKEFIPGVAGGILGRPVLAGSTLFFAAADRAAGAELWGLASMAAAVPIGTPCGLSPAQTPRASGSGTPYLGSASFQARVAHAPANAPALLALAADGGNPVSFMGCDLHVGAVLVTAGTMTDAVGAAAIPLPIPNVPALRGGVVYCQWFVAQPGGPFANIAAASDGLQLILADA
jgi:ELWxxDGT repeat protein